MKTGKYKTTRIISARTIQEDFLLRKDRAKPFAKYKDQCQFGITTFVADQLPEGEICVWSTAAPPEPRTVPGL